ncbi:unnamed protein product [Ambrosiozyma monospora]|uniref:Unnamed protein product n=1 Tax=Ambrosiozyma monospora TaxID=43982 RepID=A0A9W6YSU0_AMBMO|nr:unnamed protein product [Ambrosiozyma monospora]
MKLLKYLLVFFFALQAMAWTAEDLELFTIQKEIIKLTKKPEMDFYKYMKLPNGIKSTSKEIETHYKKLSRKWHPDKNPKNGEKFTKLGLIVSVFRDAQRKQRYDYYVKNGFPNLKTLQFENRYKPGVLEALLAVTIFGSIVNYILISLSFKQTVKRISSVKSDIFSVYINSTMNVGSDPQIIVYQSGNFFLVKANVDNSVWMIDLPFEEGEDYSLGMGGQVVLKHEIFEKLMLKYNTVDDSMNPELNRRQRRMNAKNIAAQHLEDLDESMLVLVDPDQLEPVGIKDLVIVKLVKSLFNKLIGGKVDKKKANKAKKFGKKKPAPSGPPPRKIEEVERVDIDVEKNKEDTPEVIKDVTSQDEEKIEEKISPKQKNIKKRGNKTQSRKK